MQRRNIRLSLAAILVGAVLVAGSLACFSGGDDAEDTGPDLDKIERQTRDNIVELAVLSAQFDHMEKANQELFARIAALSGENQALNHRIAALEEENRELTHRIAVLESAAPTGAGSSPAK